MLKAKKIIRDLKSIKGGKFFGYYEVKSNKKESKNLDISELDLIRDLSYYEIDFKKLYKVDFDDVVYEDLEGNYISIDLDVESGNSYNWSSQIVFNYNHIRVIDRYDIEHDYIAVKFHRFGDVRGNYTDYIVLDMSMDEFFETVMEATQVSCCIEYKRHTYSISTDAIKEGCLFDIYSDDIELDAYDVYLNINNYRRKADIKKALIEYLKKEGV